MRRGGRHGGARRVSAVRIAAAGTACALLGLATASSSAVATPGSGVSSETLAEGVSRKPVRVRTHGPTDVRVRTITVEPGGQTGWHYHPGRLIAVIASGTLTRTLAAPHGTCTVETSGPGDAFVEEDGARHVHNGRNLGSEPVIMQVTYVLPQGAPDSLDAADPGCHG